MYILDIENDKPDANVQLIHSVLKKIAGTATRAELVCYFSGRLMPTFMLVLAFLTVE